MKREVGGRVPDACARSGYEIVIAITGPCELRWRCTCVSDCADEISRTPAHFGYRSEERLPDSGESLSRFRGAIEVRVEGQRAGQRALRAVPIAGLQVRHAEVVMEHGVL